MVRADGPEPSTAPLFFVGRPLGGGTLCRCAKLVLGRTLNWKSGKGWISKGSQHHSSKLRRPKHLLKLHSSDTVKVWWLPILTRGKLHIEILPENFPGDTEEGAVLMVQKVRAALNIRFQGVTAPTVLFTDRGNGSYDACTGRITSSYHAALRTHGLQAFFATDATIQPGQLQ